MTERHPQNLTLTFEGFDPDTGADVTIPLLSWGQGTSNATSLQDKIVGTPTETDGLLQVLHFTKWTDAHTPDLNAHCFQGTVFNKAVLSAELRLNPGEAEDDFPNGLRDEFSIELDTVTLEHGSISGARDGVPTEGWALDYRAITWVYMQRQPDGQPIITHRRSAEQFPKTQT